MIRKGWYPMKKKHMIFDLDGTLSDTAKATSVAFDKMSKEKGLPEVTYDKIIAAMGLPDLEFYENVYPSLSKEKLVEIFKEADALEEEMIITLGEDILFSDVKNMLINLKKKNCSLYIASTGSKSHVNATFTASGIKDIFTSVSCGEPEKISMVKKIIGNSDKNEWVMVGDMYKDSEAARKNSILALGAGFGYLSAVDQKLFDSILWKPEDIYHYL